MRAAAHLLLVVGLFGCATQPDEHQSETRLLADDGASIEPAALAMMHAARDAVAARFGVDLSHVESVVADKDAMRQWHKQAVERGFAGRFSIEHRDRLIEQSVDGRLDSLLAYYDYNKKAIVYDADNVDRYLRVLKREGISSEEAVMALFLHEWVHAADDARVDFSELDKRYGGNDLASAAVFEGHAEMVSRELCLEFGCAESAIAASDEFLRFHGASASLAILPGHRADSSVLRYVEGRRYMERLAALPDGDRLVEEALMRPPRDAVTIFAPDPRPDARREAVNESLQEALLAFELPLRSGDWLHFADNPVSAHEFAIDKQQRERFVADRLARVLGAAQLLFFEHSGPSLRPVEMRITQLVNAEQARMYALEAVRAFRLSSGSLIGANVSMRTGANFTREISVYSDGLAGIEHTTRASLHYRGEQFGTLNFTAIASGDHVMELRSRISDGEHGFWLQGARKWLASIDAR